MQCIKYLKHKLNMINNTYLYPIRTSDYSLFNTSPPRIFYLPSNSPKNL